MEKCKNFQNQMEPPLIKTNNEYNNFHQRKLVLVLHRNCEWMDRWNDYHTGPVDTLWGSN